MVLFLLSVSTSIKNGHSARTVPLVGTALVVCTGKLSGTFLDGTLDVVLGHIVGFCTIHSGSESWIGIKIPTTLFRSDHDLLDELGENAAALGIFRRFFSFDRGPLGMTGHLTSPRMTSRNSPRIMKIYPRPGKKSTCSSRLKPGGSMVLTHISCLILIGIGVKRISDLETDDERKDTRCRGESPRVGGVALRGDGGKRPPGIEPYSALILRNIQRNDFFPRGVDTARRVVGLRTACHVYPNGRETDRRNIFLSGVGYYERQGQEQRGTPPGAGQAER